MKIVILDGCMVNYGDLSWESISSLGELEVYDDTPLEKRQERIGDAEAIFVNRCRIDDDLLKQSKNLKFIGTFGTGFNCVDIEAASQHGIVVCNVPSYSTYAVAQATIGLLLEISNKISFFSDYVKNAKWQTPVDTVITNLPQIELWGKSFGIIGFGEIGKRTAIIADALGMDVFAYSPSAKQNSEFNNVKILPFGDIIKTCDIISLHCPLNSNTKSIINKNVIDQMKKGAILLNTARGGLIDAPAVAEALDSGHLGWYGADVLLHEPPLPDDVLAYNSKAVITPHVAWHPLETRQRLIKVCGENLKAYINGQPQNIVNQKV